MQKQLPQSTDVDLINKLGDVLNFDIKITGL